MVAALMAVILLLSACTEPGEVVHPGPPAAAVKAVNDESYPISQPLPAPVATCTNAPAGWALREDRQPGSEDLLVHQASTGLGPVVGYIDSVTAVCGQVIAVHLSSHRDNTQVRLRAMRVGDYRGRGARLVWQSRVLTANPQEQAAPTGPDRVITEHWPVATTIEVNASWPPGLYLIEIVPVGPAKPSYMPLVVRTSGARSPSLLVFSDLTLLAYNSYGRRSLYGGPGHTHTQRVANRSYVASADRPVAWGALRQVVFAMNVPLIRFLSRHSIAYDVTTDSSLDATPSQLHGQRSVLIGGHSEYWTKRMYDAAVQARDAGTNFAFLGANEVYWQGRIERDQNGRARALTVYRDPKLDTRAKTGPDTTTVQWRHSPLLRDPAALVGEGMSVVGVRGPYVVNTTPSWLFAGTDLHKGDVLALAVGNEADAQEPPTGHSPSTLQVLLRGVAVPTGGTKPFLLTAGYYSAPGGSGVFAAGTTYWVCNLDSTCPDDPTPPATSAAIQQITLNLVNAFVVAGAGRLHPSAGTPYESAAQLANQLPVGGGGGNSESKVLK